MLLHLQVIKGILPSLERRFLLLQQFGEGAAPPAAEGAHLPASHTCAFPASILLTQLQIRVVLPKKSNVQQVTGIDQGFMIIVFSHPYRLCHMHLCKVIQSKACRNSVNSVHLMRWWCKWLCTVQVVKELELVFAFVWCGFLLLLQSLSLQQMQLGDSWCTGRESCSQTVELHWQVRHLRFVRAVRHTGEFPTGNQNKQRIEGIKWRALSPKMAGEKKDQTVKEF